MFVVGDVLCSTRVGCMMDILCLFVCVCALPRPKYEIIYIINISRSAKALEPTNRPPSILACMICVRGSICVMCVEMVLRINYR